MGEFNRFRNLKVSGVEKLVKFKQDVLLKAAMTGKLITPDHYEIVKGGACVAYTFGWISQQFKVQGNLFHKTQPKPKSIDDKQHIATAAKLVKNFMTYMKTGKEKANFMAAADELGDQFGVEITSGDTLDGTGTLIEVINYFAKNPNNMGFNEAASITISFENSNEGHSVGLFRDPNDKQLHFFDPNVGEYRMKSDQIDRFFQEYVRVLTQTGENQFNWTLSPLCWGMLVTKSL